MYNSSAPHASLLRPQLILAHPNFPPDPADPCRPTVLSAQPGLKAPAGPSLPVVPARRRSAASPFSSLKAPSSCRARSCRRRSYQLACLASASLPQGHASLHPSISCTQPTHSLHTAYVFIDLLSVAHPSMGTNAQHPAYLLHIYMIISTLLNTA